MRDMLRALKPASSPFASEQPASRAGSVRGAAVRLKHDYTEHQYMAKAPALSSSSSSEMFHIPFVLVTAFCTGT